MGGDDAGRGLDALARRWGELRALGLSEEARALCDGNPGLLAHISRVHDPKDGDRPPAPPRRRSAAGGAFDGLRFLASGGLGEVYLARQADLNREVALKFLKADRAGDPENVRRFLQEAEITGRLEHPGVVPVYGMGRDEDGHPAYAMRLIRGETLQDAIDAFHSADRPGRDRSERSMALRGLLRRFVSACNAVAFAHSRGVLHRDLKPRNIMLGPFDETLVVDWGLARTIDPGRTSRTASGPGVAPGPGAPGATPRTGGGGGTPSFMSPEQSADRPQGPESDVFALGATLYTLLAGRAPLWGEDPSTSAEKIFKGDYPGPREIKPSVPPALESICLKAMAPAPEHRYASALELAADVDRWLADEPVRARPEPAIERAARWGRRHRSLAALGALALAIGGVGLIVADRRIRAEKDAALASAREAEANLATARAALDAILAEAARDEIAYIPKTEILRREQAARVVAFHESLLAGHESDPLLASSAARARGLAARIERLTGEFGRAESLLKREAALLDRLVADYPFDPAYRERSARSALELGETYRMSGRAPEALGAFRKARALAVALRAEHPGPCEAGRLEASILADLAALQTETADDLGALESCREAEARLSACPENPALDSKLRILLQGVRGLALRGSNDPKGSEAAYRESIRMAEALRRAYPNDPDARLLLAAEKDGLGALLAADPARRAEADHAFDEGAALSRGLIQPFPHIPYYRLELANALVGRAPTRAASAAEARAILESLLKRYPDLGGVRTALGRALASQAQAALDRGDRAAARDLFRAAIAQHEAALKGNPRSPDDLGAIRDDRAALGGIPAENAPGPGPARG